jgi:starvation-inducible DNA-binding protein
MTTTVESAHLPAIGTHERTEIGNQLQSLLIELVDLSLLGKQLHWTVVGPHFHPLHLQLDDLVDSWRELADTVAERAVAIGFVPDAQSSTVAQTTPIATVERRELHDHEVLTELTGRLAATTERTREKIERLGELDAASQDVVIEVIRELEKQLWMVRAQLRKQ